MLNKKNKSFKKHTIDELAEGIINQNIYMLSKAITLLESTRPDHYQKARKVLDKVLPYATPSIRIGITGIPGVGKSTFIESIGKYVLQEGRKIAILAIDPSSQISKGSILGDKTRMEEISRDKNVFIRPSPAGQQLGGVNRKTRETILLCEAAGFNTIFVETVGVGQSETAVHSMVDCLVLLMLSRTGDELQGIKKGIMEIGDIIAVNKVEDIENSEIKISLQNIKNALHLLPPNEYYWFPKVLTCSAQADINILTIWKLIVEYQEHMIKRGFFQNKRIKQNTYCMYETINNSLEDKFYSDLKIKEKLNILKTKVNQGKMSPFAAADELISTFISPQNNQ